MSLLHKLFRKKYDREPSEASDQGDRRMEEDVPVGSSRQELQGEKEESMSLNTEEEYEVVEREILPAKIICPDCGGITLEGLELCDKCGGELL